MYLSVNGWSVGSVLCIVVVWRW